MNTRFRTGSAGNQDDMSASPLAQQPLATALAASLLALGITGAVWASSTADAGPTTPHSSQHQR